MAKPWRDFERGEVPDAEEYLAGPGPPLEAQLIDLCDEIGYDTADLDDGYHAGLVSMEDACRASEMFRELDDAVSMQFPGAHERVRIHEVVRGLIDWLVSGLIDGTIAAAHGLADLDAVRGHPERGARLAPATAQAAPQLKCVLRATV